MNGGAPQQPTSGPPFPLGEGGQGVGSGSPFPRGEGGQGVRSGGQWVGSVLLYDGVCGFCNSSVRFLLRHERRHTLRFAALQGEFAGRVLARHPDLTGIDSLVWAEGESSGERVWVRSSAAMKALAYLGGFWKVLLVLALIPRPIRDFFYDVFARRRYRWFGKYDACPIPAAEVRNRFLS